MDTQTPNSQKPLFWRLTTQVGPALILFLGVQYQSGFLMTLGSLFLFGSMMLNGFSFLAQKAFIDMMIKINYKPSFPVVLLKGFDILGVAALLWASYPLAALMYAISCGLAWTVYERFLQVKQEQDNPKSTPEAP